MVASPSGKMIGSALELSAASPEFVDRLKKAKLRHSEMESPSWRDGPLHVIIGARAEGKTTLALKWLTECPPGVERVLIVPNEEMAKHLRWQCGFKGNDQRIISFRTLRNRGARRNVEYGIDESVQILSELLGLREMPSLLTVGHADEWQGTLPDA